MTVGGSARDERGEAPSLKSPSQARNVSPYGGEVKEESKRGEASLKNPSPPSPCKERGIKVEDSSRGEVNKQSVKG